MFVVIWGPSDVWPTNELGGESRARIDLVNARFYRILVHGVAAMCSLIANITRATV
jgi:hypothetical protein